MNFFLAQFEARGKPISISHVLYQRSLALLTSPPLPASRDLLIQTNKIAHRFCCLTFNVYALSGENALSKAKTATQRLLMALDGTPIVLVGMMGAGKTSVGRRLAHHLERQFLDSDHEIEAAAGMNIEDYFTTHGEKQFRLGEAKVVQRLLEEKNIVLATGGGAFINETTRQIIEKKAVSVWINAEFDLLFARVSRKSNRPLLKTPNPRQTLKDLIDQRYPTYELADVHVTTSEVPHDTVANEIIGALNLYFNNKSQQS